MKIKKVNYYGLDHEAVKKNFNVDRFVNDILIKTKHDYVPAAVYHSAHPDRSKSHKDYMFLYKDGAGQMFVSGKDAHNMEENRYTDGVLCMECSTVLYSVQRHHYHTCGCPNDAMVDGGRDYLRCGALDMTKMTQVIIDLLTDEVFDTTGVKIS